MVNTETIDANVNLSKCLVHKTSIGHDVVTNVCTGETFIVAWQAGDWLNLFGLAVAMSLLALVLVGIVFLLRDTLR